MDKYRQFGQTPHIEEVTSPRPIWTTWTTEDRHARRCVCPYSPAMCPYPQQQRPTSEEEQHAAGHGVFCLAGRKGGERTAAAVYSGERVEAKAGRPLIWTTWTIWQPESRKALRTAARYDMDNVDKIRTTSKSARGIRRLLSPDVLEIHAAPWVQCRPPRIGTTQTNRQRTPAKERGGVLYHTTQGELF